MAFDKEDPMIWHRDATRSNRHSGWLARALISGFIATGLMTTIFVLAYLLATLFGSANPDAPLFRNWLWALANNPVTEMAQSAVPFAVLLHFTAGIGWALVYAAVAEPRLRGSAWQRGMIFATVPAALSLIVFLPLVGGGFLGLQIGAGPLPIIGNLILHAVYGFTLGQIYSARGDWMLTDSGRAESPHDIPTIAHAERTMAQGIVIGFVAGALLGGALGIAVFAEAQLYLAIMIGALGGTAVGALAGSFLGLEPEARHDG
jgi:hypothetical protein